MKIGITCHATVGGSGAIATALGKLLAEEGHEVHFVCHDIPFNLAGTRHPGITVHEVEATQYPPLRYPPHDMALAVKMANVADAANLDLVHVHYAIPHALSAYLAREMLAPKPLKIVCTLHGTDITLVGADPSYRPLVRFCIEACDAVTSVSNWLTKTVKECFRLNKEVKTVYNFVDMQEYCRDSAKTDLKLSDEEGRGEGQGSGTTPFAQQAPEGHPVPTIVHISNFRPVKRVSDVIEIFKRVRDAMSCRLLMVGDGPDRAKAAGLARSLGIAPDVIFMGVTQRVVDILSNASVFVLTSEMESFGLAALEAMACEVPVVTADVGGLREVVEDGQSGFLLPLGDVDAMAEKTAEILRNRDLKKKLGRRGRAIAVEKFPPRAALHAYLEIYRSVLS